VLGRWHDFVGTSDIFRKLDQKVGWWRDRIWGALKGEPPEAKKVQVAVESGLEALIREEGEKAAERAEAAWRANPAGRALVESSGLALGHPSPDFPTLAARTIRDWQGDVMDLVSEEGADRRTRARLAAFGVNGVGVALILLVFSQTGGLLGAEVGVAGGTAVLAQRVLESVFGDGAVRKMAEKAKAGLDARIQSLMDAEAARYERVLADTTVTADTAARIRKAVDDVEHTRVAEMAALGLKAATPAYEQPAIEPASTPEAVVLQRVDDPGAEVVEAEMVDVPRRSTDGGIG